MGPRSKRSRPSGVYAMPKTPEDFQSLVDKVWSDACDAEFSRADEEYKFLRSTVNAFDAVVSPEGVSPWSDVMRGEKLNGLGPERALELGKRVRLALEGAGVAVEAERQAIVEALAKLSDEKDDECERYDEAHGRGHPDEVIRLSGQAEGLWQAAEFVKKRCTKGVM